ncbi:MAG: DEAD/DEAH box helicase [Stigonema ocellatum SAG 48.90 = DSM 106950]|nr:DEAD/DEAH box helicase [Stigonema ocellatum SAG 48.90 = DSM 106950]
MLALRDYQQDLINKVLASWSGGMRKLLLQLSTGGGKTIIFATVASEFTCRGEGVLVVAHREELILQAGEKLAMATRVQPGIIKAGYKPIDSLIQVGSIQTLYRRKTYPKAELVIVDEAHHSSAASYRKLLDAYPNAFILGVTGTPRREDGYGLRDIFDKLICSITTRELIALGYLTDYKLIAGFKYSQHRVPQKRDFTKKELEQVASDYKPEEVLKQWRNFCDGKKTILFAVNVQHSVAIAAKFYAAGIPAEHLDGDTPQDERKAILERFKSGITKIITNCAILTEGFDCPDTFAVVIARPTTSVTLWLQMIGRVLRPAPGKDYAIILDMTDNWFRLGRPCDKREWSLDPISCDPDTLGVRCCPSCHHVFKPIPALIRTLEYFNPKKRSFVTHYEVDCPYCGKAFRWVLEDSPGIDNGGVTQIVSTSGIEFKEVPPDVRPVLLRPILELKKSQKRKTTHQIQIYLDGLKTWILSHQDLNIAELKYAVYLLELDNSESQIINYLMLVLSSKIRKAKTWDDVAKIMSSRPNDVKKIIWSRLASNEKDKLNQMKFQYEQELKEWLTEENLEDLANDLSVCDDIEMISSLWQIYNRQAIRLASKKIIGHQGVQIAEWIKQLDAMS